MHTPTKTQWQTVINNFKKVLPQATLENHLDMNQWVVRTIGDDPLYSSHKCGTIHCVGGWYTIATCKIPEDKSYVGFSIGADQMAIDLGFEDKHELRMWAHENPKIWGNEHGTNIFGHIRAYNNAKTLSEIVTYLEGVRDRSPN